MRCILAERGIEPAPERGKRTRWEMFLAAHRDAVAAADLFTVAVLTFRGLARYRAFFVIELKSRWVGIAGVSCHPRGEWMTQVARNLADAVDGFLPGARDTVLERDSPYTAAFRRILKSSGVKVVRLPARSPNLNPFVERLIGTLSRELTDRVIVLGERHLLRPLKGKSAATGPAGRT